MFLPKIRSKTRTSAFIRPIQYSPRSSSQYNQGKKREINSIEFGKEEIKLPLFADDKIVYVENPSKYTNKLLELISEFSKVTE